MKLSLAAGISLRSRTHPGRQRGVVLYVALVVMIVMMLAGVAMLRSVGAGVGVAGNLAFKQNSTKAADRGTDVAIPKILALAALSTNPWTASPTLPTAPLSPPSTPPNLTVLDVDQPAYGYTANWVPGFDPLATYSATNPATVDWAAAPLATPVGGDDGAGNTVRYVIHRMCKFSNLDTSPESLDPLSGEMQQCVGHGVTIRHVTKDAGSPARQLPLYRITSRTDGPRNTVSYVQVMVY